MTEYSVGGEVLATRNSTDRLGVPRHKFRFAGHSGTEGEQIGPVQI